MAPPTASPPRSFARLAPVLAPLLLLLGFALGAPMARGGPGEDRVCRDLEEQAIRLLQEADTTGTPAPALRAAGLLERAMRLCPDEPGLPFHLTLAYLVAREEPRARAAQQSLEATLRREMVARKLPEADALKDPRARYVNARLLFTFANAPEGAIEELTRLRARDPLFQAGPVTSLLFRCHLALANEKARRQDWAEAIRQTELASATAAGDVPRQDIARRNLGQIYRMAERWVESQQVFEDLATRYPRDAVLQYAFASILADQLKFTEALGVWEKVLALEGQPDTVDPRERDQIADARLRYGVTLIHLGRLDEGRKALLAYAKAHDRDARVWFQLGSTALESFDDPDGAIEWLEKARALDPWCERTLRLLLDLYTNARRDEGRARTLQAHLDDAEATTARKQEMDRRKATRADGTTGCE